MALGQTKINGITFSTSTGRNVYTPNTSSLLDDYFCYTNVGPSPTFSATGSIVPLLSVFLPAGSLKRTNLWSIDACFTNNSANQAQGYLYISREDSLDSAVSILIATGELVGSGTRYNVLKRTFINSLQLIGPPGNEVPVIFTNGINFNQPVNNDYITPNASFNTDEGLIVTDPNLGYYFILAASFSSSSVVGEWMKVSSRSFLG
jgi:hypothetical protein